MKSPPVWDGAQLEAERAKAMELFRKQRMEEPLEQYLAHFDEYQSVVEELLESTVDLSQIGNHLVSVLTAPKTLEAFRYLAGPPISDDDLKVLAEAVLTKTKLTNDEAMRERIRSIVMSGLDRRRFPWVSDGREPTEVERASAVVASAALIATQRLQTKRRSEGRREQEAAVKAALKGIGFSEVPSRTMSVLSDAPAAGEFCSESSLGGQKADVIVGLWDKRVMPIECKVSNSSTNSVKRLNREASRKAQAWKQDFGVVQVIPAAVLSGVYKLHNLKEAQERGLALFWAHDLASLTDWINQAH